MKIFIIPFHVQRMDNSIMPLGFSGAYGNCYSTGNDYVDATEKALQHLLADGIYPEEILQPIFEMDSMNWTQHISENWPDDINSLKNQVDFEHAMKRGEVVYGPFGLYNSEQAL